MATVSFRCSDEQKAELELRSQGNVSAYVVAQLFDDKPIDDALLHRLDDLREDLIEVLQSRASSSSDGDSRFMQSVMIEMLMMMRQQFNKTAIKTAHAEVARLGLPVFQSEDYPAQEGHSS